MLSDARRYIREWVCVQDKATRRKCLEACCCHFRVTKLGNGVRGNRTTLGSWMVVQAGAKPALCLVLIVRGGLGEIPECQSHEVVLRGSERANGDWSCVQKPTRRN